MLLDARWLGIGGVGRVTENLLAGLCEAPPPGRWFVAGPAHRTVELWPGAEWVPCAAPAEVTFAQADVRRLRGAGADVAVFLHQIRPLRPVAPVEVTLVHDTIPIRYPTRHVPGAAFEYGFRRAARLSTLVATVSRHAASCIQRDLGVSAERIRLVQQPIDHHTAARVRAARSTTVHTADALYVGRDAPHKNLDRLVCAFAATDLQRRGGSLVLVGVGDAPARRLRSLAAGSGTRLVVPGVVPQERLEELMASCAVLVQPSIEEGFGLPVAEALAAGVPVAASSAGALVEILAGRRPTFDPFDVSAMARAIDDAARTDLDPVVDWPTPVDLATSMLAVVDDARAAA